MTTFSWFLMAALLWVLAGSMIVILVFGVEREDIFWPEEDQ